MIKLEEINLNRLQNISKIIAVLSFVVFIGIIIFGAFQVRKIAQADRELDRIRQEIKDKQAILDEMNGVIANKDNQLQNKDTQIQAQTNTISKVLNKSSKETINKVLDNDPLAAQAMPRVYVHIGDESERKKAEKIAEALQVGGYIVPKIENVGHIAAKTTEIRYCQDKGQQDDLDKIQSLLAGNGITVKIKKPLNLPSCSLISSVRSYELWLESDAANQTITEKPSIDTKKPIVNTKKTTGKQQY